jgi:CRISPR/Cas system CSM-associated protein Csm3 (group 7 of RAMP superfamily)
MMPDDRTPWPFRERWRIEGCLVTEGPLHIGSGDITTHPDLKDGDEPVEIADCIRGVDGLPILPATSIKGVLRAWLQGRVEKAETCLGPIPVNEFAASNNIVSKNSRIPATLDILSRI